MIINYINLFFVKDESGHPGEEDWLTKHLLSSNRGERVGSVMLGETGTEDTGQCLLMGSNPALDMGHVTVNRTDDTDMFSRVFEVDLLTIHINIEHSFITINLVTMGW